MTQFKNLMNYIVDSTKSGELDCVVQVESCFNNVLFCFDKITICAKDYSQVFTSYIAADNYITILMKEKQNGK